MGFVALPKVPPLKVFPTLHIRQGQAVQTLVSETAALDPLALVARLAERGCCRLTLVDVDAAEGKGNNRELMSQVMRRFRQAIPKACLWVGGGVRASDQAQFYLDHGAQWLMVGTILHKSPMVVDQLLGRFREHLTATIDARRGIVHASGWAERSPLDAGSLALRIREQGFRRILFMDIPHPEQEGPDFSTARLIAETARLPLFMGGTLSPDMTQRPELESLQGILLDLPSLLNAPDLLQAQAQSCA